MLATWERHQEMKDIINTENKLWAPARPLWVFIYLPSVLLGNRGLQATSAFKDKLTATFSNESSFLMPMGSDAFLCEPIKPSKACETARL